MPTVSFISSDGTKKDVEIPNGQSAMKGAIANGVMGIVAECGGSCMCATCHVYVHEDQLAKLPEMELGEDAMLDGTASPRRPNSRLSCQLVMTPALDGLVVRLPPGSRNLLKE